MPHRRTHPRFHQRCRRLHHSCWQQRRRTGHQWRWAIRHLLRCPSRLSWMMRRRQTYCLRCRRTRPRWHPETFPDCHPPVPNRTRLQRAPRARCPKNRVLRRGLTHRVCLFPNRLHQSRYCPMCCNHGHCSWRGWCSSALVFAVRANSGRWPSLRPHDRTPTPAHGNTRRHPLCRCLPQRRTRCNALAAPWRRAWRVRPWSVREQIVSRRENCETW